MAVTSRQGLIDYWLRADITLWRLKQMGHYGHGAEEPMVY